MVRKVGIGLAIILRIVLLVVVLQAIETCSKPFAHVDNALLHGELTIHSLIVLAGGAFILYTALKEIMHMLSIDELGHEAGGDAPMRSVNGAIAMIVVGVLMMVMADTVSELLKRNRMYEVLGLFILFLVGVMLVTEGGHLAHLELAGHPVEAMSKSTFYFLLIALVIVDVAQGRYQKKLDIERAHQGEGVA